MIWVKNYMQTVVVITHPCLTVVRLKLGHGWVMASHTKIIDVITCPWASYQIHKTDSCACAGNAGNVLRKRSRHASRHVRDEVPWCIPVSLTSGLLWSRWRVKRSRHSRCMRNPHFYVHISGKRHMSDAIKYLINIPHKHHSSARRRCSWPGSWNHTSRQWLSLAGRSNDHGREPCSAQRRSPEHERTPSSTA